MQDAENRSNNLTRRGAMTAAGGAITVAAIHTTGGALAQATEQSAAPPQETPNASAARNSINLTHKRAKTNGVDLHYVTAGRGTAVLCMHGWPQNHREFLPVIERLC
jgi:hypothetical protein